MKRTSARLLLITSMAGAFAVGGASAAMARDVCTGTYEINGCEYCAYNNGATHQTSSRCDEGQRNYSWQQCGLWVNNACLQGNFLQDVG